jgi:hypothetical protein
MSDLWSQAKPSRCLGGGPSRRRQDAAGLDSPARGSSRSLGSAPAQPGHCCAPPLTPAGPGVPRAICTLPLVAAEGRAESAR